MDGRLGDEPLIILAGLSFYGDPFARSAGWTEENEIGRLWARFMDLRHRSGEAFPEPTDPDRIYEVHLFDSETETTGRYEVFVGYAVAEIRTLPALLVAKVLPAGRRSWFTLAGRGIVDEDNYRAMDDWIEEQGLVRAGSWFANVYDRRFKGLEALEESEIDVCIPVR